jgi:dihydrofolate reductase
MAAYWPTATDEEGEKIKTYMNGIAKIAVSRSMPTADWNNTRVVSEPVSELKKLKAETGKSIFIFGSAELADSLLKEGLVDEIRMCLVPVILGGGNPHFKPGDWQLPLRLLDSTTTKNGAVILRYEPVQAWASMAAALPQPQRDWIKPSAARPGAQAQSCGWSLRSRGCCSTASGTPPHRATAATPQLRH